jgi:hypothetical protein
MMGVHRKPRQFESPPRLRMAETVCCACTVPAHKLRYRNVVGLGPTPLCAACSQDVDTIDAMLQRFTSAQRGAGLMGDIIMRNHEGVVLRYADPSVQRRHHIERRPQAFDRLRTALLRAEREMTRLETICEHLEVSEVGGERISWALQSIRAFLEMERPTLGLARVGT